jgi:Leucine-rich repeat (LRR) protein
MALLIIFKAVSYTFKCKWRHLLRPVAWLILILVGSVSLHSEPIDPRVGSSNSYARYQTADGRQIVVLVGPGAVESRNALARNLPTFLMLRTVPDGAEAARRIAHAVPVSELSLHGVDLTTDDLAALFHSCHNLTALSLITPESIPRDEISGHSASAGHTVGASKYRPPDLSGLAQMSGLTALELVGYPLPSDRLAFLTHLTGLKRLYLRDMSITDCDLKALDGLDQLERIDLSGTLVTGSGLCHLRSLPLLAVVGLDRTKVDDESIRKLDADQLPRLKVLSVAGCALTGPGHDTLTKLFPFAEIYAQDESIPLRPPSVSDAQQIRRYRTAQIVLATTSAMTTARIRGQSLSQIVINPDRRKWTGSWIFQEMAFLYGIRELKLSGCNVSSEDLALLGGQDQLEDVQLDDTPVNDRAATMLARLPKLKILDLSRTNLTDAGVRILGQSIAIEQLELSGTRITDESVRELEGLRSLTYIGLNNCRIGDGGAEQLAKSSSLRRLSLNGTQITDRGLIALSQLPGLLQLFARDCNITEDGARSLLSAKSLESLQVDGDSLSAEFVAELVRHVENVQAHANRP